MNAVFILAGLTIKEAVRRRIFFASGFVALLFVAFAFLPIPIHEGFITGHTMAQARDNSGKIFAWLGCGTIKFFASILAVTLAAGAISAEVEKGVLSTIVPKPLNRAQVYTGKWLGLMALLLASVAVWAVLLAWAVWMHTHTFHVRLFTGVLSVCLFPLLFTTLTLCFSSFATYALSAGLALIAAGMALAQDLLHTLSLPIALNAPILDTLSRAVGYIVPIGRMNHWISRGLAVGQPDSAGIDFSVYMSPRNASIATSGADMAYILVYIAAAFAVGLIVFQKRDL